MSVTAILLGTYNGARYLPAQLDSLIGQHETSWRIDASDDGSSDDTLDILHAYQRTLGADRLRIRSGPRAGPAANFMSMVADPRIEADFYAYCDQDDLWEPDKLQRALAHIASVSGPALTCARTRLIDVHGRDIGLSPLRRRPPGFANALVECIAGGNTMLFNAAARALLPVPGVEILNYDWWTYLAISGCGGRVFYDPRPVLRYRQHAGNFMGRNTGLPAAVKRLRMLGAGTFRLWNDRNAQALESLEPRLTPENRALFHAFTAARRASLPERLRLLQRTGVHRQTAIGNLGLWLAAVFGRM